LIGSLLKGAIGPIVDGVLKLIPDANARAEAEELLNVKMIDSLTTLVQGQLAINSKEAEHASLFVAGWRPAIGWICGVALGWNYIFAPVLDYVVFVNGGTVANAPHLDIGELVTILLGMLGLGGMRTYEKRVGVARTVLKNGK
jgi:hypothetical protein